MDSCKAPTQAEFQHSAQSVPGKPGSSSRSAKQIVAALVYYFYKFIISPFLTAISGGQVRGCRFPESCADYSYRKFREEPVHIALWKSVKRVVSCHPFSLPLKKSRSVES